MTLACCNPVPPTVRGQKGGTGPAPETRLAPQHMVRISVCSGIFYWHSRVWKSAQGFPCVGTGMTNSFSMSLEMDPNTAALLKITAARWPSVRPYRFTAASACRHHPPSNQCTPASASHHLPAPLLSECAITVLALGRALDPEQITRHWGVEAELADAAHTPQEVLSWSLGIFPQGFLPDLFWMGG